MGSMIQRSIDLAGELWQLGDMIPWRLRQELGSVWCYHALIMCGCCTEDLCIALRCHYVGLSMDPVWCDRIIRQLAAVSPSLHIEAIVRETMQLPAVSISTIGLRYVSILMWHSGICCESATSLVVREVQAALEAGEAPWPTL